MADKKTDRRVLYTRMVIKESLISLLRENSIAKITVTEICRGAGINRATFYAHYSDPLDLLYSMEAELIEEVSAKLEGNFAAPDDALRETLTRVFEYIRENAKVCDVLLSDTGDTSFRTQVVTILAERFVGEWTASKSMSQEDAEYLYTFAAIGSVGLIRKWLDDGMKKQPSEMADLVLDLTARGYSAF